LKTKLVLIVVIVAVVAASAGVLMMSSHPSGGAPSNEKIEIPQGGATATGGLTGAFTLTVHNIGSGQVTVATIYVDSIAYTYSSSAAPGTFSANTDQISPGQTVTFTITTTAAQSTASSSALIHFRAVTTNGTVATADIPNPAF
jgi:hypothetical protein